jgi:hypothetical protein
MAAVPHNDWMNEYKFGGYKTWLLHCDCASPIKFVCDIIWEIPLFGQPQAQEQIDIQSVLKVITQRR